MPSKIELFHGDCLEVMRDIPDGSVDMVLADLPYGSTCCAWDVVIPFELLWEQYERVIKDSGAIVLFGSQPFTSLLITSNIKLFRYGWVWDKCRGVGHLNAKKRPMMATEDICVFYKNPCTYNPQMRDRDKPRKSKNRATQEVYGKTQDHFEGDVLEKRYPINLISFSKSSQGDFVLHPTQKPVALCEYLIKTYTNEGETVLDNCMGSGTTGVACLRTMRSFIGIEKEEKYFKIASDRIRKEQDDIEQSLYYRACDLQE
jgi:site-specific DNA-methyltransferase (adenine-specific)